MIKNYDEWLNESITRYSNRLLPIEPIRTMGNIVKFLANKWEWPPFWPGSTNFTVLKTDVAIGFLAWNTGYWRAKGLTNLNDTTYIEFSSIGGSPFTTVEDTVSIAPDLLSDSFRKSISTILYHEILHSISGMKFTEVAFDKRHGSIRKILFKKNMRKPEHEYRNYFLSDEEINAYFGEMYYAFSALIADESNIPKVKDLLGKGDTTTIFQMLPDGFVERRVHQLYFGGTDKSSIDKLSELKQYEWGSKDLTDGMIKTYIPEQFDKYKKNFLKSLHGILTTSNLKYPDVKVYVNADYYAMLPDYLKDKVSPISNQDIRQAFKQGTFEFLRRK